MIPLDKIMNQFALFENNYLNFYNIEFTDESLNDFLTQVEKFSFFKDMISIIGISKIQEKNQNITCKHIEMLKKTFIRWDGVFRAND
jgi:hypothetical protein